MERIKHPVDELFKEALQEHQVKPSDAARQRFLDEAATVKISGKRSRSRWLFLLGGLVVVTSALMVLWLHQDSSKSAVRTPKYEVDNSQSAVVSLQSEAYNSRSAVGSPQSEARGSQQEAVNESGTTDHEGYFSPTVNPASQSSGVVTSPPPSFGASSTSIPSTSNVLPPPSYVPSSGSGGNEGGGISVGSGGGEDGVSVDTVSSVLSQPAGPVPTPGISAAIPDSVAVLPSVVQQEDTLTIVDTDYSPDKSKKKNRSSSWQFATSVYYVPEWMFNTLEGDKFVTTIGLEESLLFGRYVLRTGLGLSIAKGTNELMVEYNDYQGSYNHLDSISFAWDEKYYHLLPTYYLSDKDVWDSLLRLDYPKVIKRYTYLQIPLILGYDFLQKKWVSIGFRAGPILSLLLQSKQLSEEYDPGKNRVVQINQVTPDRIATNWQLQGGINVSLHISPRFGLELEPNVKYYFNSVYEKSDATKKPWSVALRASFRIRY